MSDCVFCSIAAGDIPSQKVYGDDRVYAFLDVNPLRRGHTLVIPRAHGVRLADLTSEDAGALMQATRLISRALADMTGDEGATIAIHDGPAAGQEVPHVHIHIVPRTDGDLGGPIHALFAEREPTDEDDRGVLAAQLRDALGVSDA